MTHPLIIRILFLPLFYCLVAVVSESPVPLPAPRPCYAMCYTVDKQKFNSIIKTEKTLIKSPHFQGMLFLVANKDVCCDKPFVMCECEVLGSRMELIIFLRAWLMTRIALGIPTNSLCVLISFFLNNENASLSIQSRDFCKETIAHCLVQKAKFCGREWNGAPNKPRDDLRRFATPFGQEYITSW